MNRTKLLTGLVIVLALLNIGLLLFIWFKKPEAKHMRGQEPHRVETYLEKKLNLSEEQSASFVEKRREHFNKTRKVMDEIRKEKKKAAIMLSKGVDSLEIEVVLMDINQKTNNLERLNFWHIKRLRDICNHEQQEKFDRIILKVNDHSFRNKSRMRKVH